MGAFEALGALGGLVALVYLAGLLFLSNSLKLKASYVQKMTFDSYLYKTVVPGNPLEDAKLAVNTIGSIVRSNALRSAAKALSA